MKPFKKDKIEYLYSKEMVKFNASMCSIMRYQPGYFSNDEKYKNGKTIIVLYREPNLPSPTKEFNHLASPEEVEEAIKELDQREAL